MSRSTRSSLKMSTIQGFHLFGTSFQKILALFSDSNGLDPRSIASTDGISVDFYSSGY